MDDYKRDEKSRRVRAGTNRLYSTKKKKGKEKRELNFFIFPYNEGET